VAADASDASDDDAAEIFSCEILGFFIAIFSPPSTAAGAGVRASCSGEEAEQAAASSS
jgi:hypothetical protein